MKKLLFLALIATATLASCKNNNATTEEVSVDTTTVYVDSTSVDSVSVDTTLQPVQPIEPGQNDQITPAVR